MNEKKPHCLLVCEIILLVVITINIVVGLLSSFGLCFVSSLLWCTLQKLREQIIIMKEYFLKCGDALRSKLLVQVTNERTGVVDYL